jgi:hypothetical protein
LTLTGDVWDIIIGGQELAVDDVCPGATGSPMGSVLDETIFDVIDIDLPEVFSL